MAATKLISLHMNKGLDMAATLEQRYDYVKNPDKTENEKLITSYGCDVKTVPAEFALSKKLYLDNTGKKTDGDIIAYQIRQSFKPGEVTPEEANRIGYETAMRFTKGEHAFVVCTHTDKPHIHNHVIFNSTNLKCNRKFDNFFFSGIALRRLSDIICLEHGLSVITPKKPSEREKYVYHHADTFRDELRLEIDKALGKRPKDFEELLGQLKSAGYEIKRGKHTAVRGKGAKRFIRFRSLGKGYSEQDIREKISCGNGEKSRAGLQKQDKEFDLLLNIQDIISKGKGPGYERWAKKYNIKNLAKVLVFLQENNIRSYEQLSELASGSSSEFNELNARIKSAEKRMDEISELRTHIINYAKTKSVYDDYNRSGRGSKFYEEHREEITKYLAAVEAFKKLGNKKLPTTKELNEEFQRLLQQKRKDYADYYDAKKKMQLYTTAKYDIDRILKYDEEKENERNARTEHSQAR